MEAEDGAGSNERTAAMAIDTEKGKQARDVRSAMKKSQSRVNDWSRDRRELGDTDHDVTSFLTNDVRIFVRQIPEMEKRITDTALDNGQLLAELAELCDGIILRGAEVVEGLDKQAAKRVKNLFRKAITPIVENSTLVARCYRKPRGYPGDYMMMEAGYEIASKQSRNTGNLLDQYFMKTYQSVICRKEKLKEYLLNLLTCRKDSSPTVRIMTVGGGPAREWFELDAELSSSQPVRKVHLTYVDQDEEALDFARSRLDGNRLVDSVEYIKESLLEFARMGEREQTEGNYDLIYGLGIADYFHDEVLSRVIGSAFRMTKIGGHLLVTHKDKAIFPLYQADWLCDWSFVERTEQEFRHLFINALSNSRFGVKLKFDREQMKEIVFGMAVKGIEL